MPYRIFRHNGAVTDRVDRYTEGANISPDEVACAEVAAALGADVSTVTAERVETLPAVQTAIPPAPPRPAPAPPPFNILTAAEASTASAPAGPLTTAVTILAKADADITAAEVKTLVLIMARFLLKKILGGWR